MKRGFAWLLLVIASVATVALTSFSAFSAEKSVKISASDVQLLKKKSVSIVLRIKNSKAIDVLSFKLKIPDGFAVIATELDPEIDGKCDCDTEDNILTFFLRGRYKGNGKLLKLTLYPLDNTERGIYTLKSFDALAVIDGKKVKFAFSSDLLYRTCREHKSSSWVVTKEPTYKKEGKKVKVCQVCSATLKTAKISKKVKRDIGDATVSYKKTYAYTGKRIKPAVTVKFKGKILKENTDYTLKYCSNKNKGKAKICISGKGIYKGSEFYYFRIK